MSEFKVLEKNEKLVSWVGVRLNSVAEGSTGFFNSIIPYFVLLQLITSSISCLVFTFIYWPQIEIISDAFVVGLVVFQAAGMYLSFGLNLKSVKAVHIHLQEIVNELGKSSDSKSKTNCI